MADLGTIKYFNAVPVYTTLILKLYCKVLRTTFWISLSGYTFENGEQKEG